MREPIVVRTLGTAHVEVGQVQVRPNAVRRFAALLYLSAEAGRRVPRRVLIDLLFPDQTERNGLHSLRELVYQLRSMGVTLESDQEGLELPGPAVRADYDEMLGCERLTLEQIRAAQGGFLPGYTPHGSEAYKEWFEPFRARAVFGLSQVLLRDHARARDVGNLDLSEAAARACLALSPFNEHAVKALAETMALGGATSDALQLLDEYGAEVGVRSPQLKLSAEALKRRIRERLQDHYRSAGELPFTGRDAEMLQLRQFLAQSQHGLGQAVLVVGDPGIGKTRLMSEFTAIAELEDTRVLRVTAHPHSSGRPMGILIDILPALTELPGALGVSPESLAMLTRLPNRPGEFRVVGVLADEPDAISRAITHALNDLVSAVSAETHVTIVVDDGHLADRASIRLLLDLVTNPSHRLLLVITSRRRNTTRAGLWADDASIIELRALEHDCTVRLSRRCLEGTSAERDDELQLWMAKIAQGNPLFLESLLNHYRVTGQQFTVPASLRDLLARRLSALQPASVTILQTCVLLAGLSTEQRLLTCLDIPFVELLTALNELHDFRLVDADGDRVLPAHPLIAEVLQSRSAAAVLRIVHRKIATCLEQEPDGHESQATLWDCADHWAAAGERQRALVCFRKCAEYAHRIGRPADAAAVLLRAADLELPETVRVEVLRDAVRAAESAGEYELVLEGVSAIRRLSTTMVHDDIELAEFAAMSVVFVDSADFSGRVMSCLSSAEADCTHRVRVGLAALKYADTYSVPSLARSVAIAVSDADLTGVDRLLQLEFRMVCQAALGEPELAIPYALQLRSLAEASAPAAALGALINAGHACWRAGLLQDCCTSIERTYELAGRCGSARRQLSAAMQLAIVWFDQGDIAVSSLWRQRVYELRNSCAREFLEFEFALFELEFALAEGHVGLAKKIRADADKRGIFSSAIRMRWRRYVDARIRQLDAGRPISAEELEAFLLDASDASSTSGILEAEMSVICVTLVAQGAVNEARQRLAGFLAWRSRYSRGAIPRQLQNVVVECGLGDMLSHQTAPAVQRRAPAQSFV